MNYEEMLNAREGVATHREELPIGTFYKKLIDKKYRNVVELRQELTDSIVFCEGIKADEKMTDGFKHPNQLHFKVKEDSGGIYEIELESGNYQTLSQLLAQNPAVIAGKDYINKVVTLMASMLKQLHEQGVYQYCLAPQMVFARKSDNMPMLLCHGSFYKGMADQGLLYKGFEDTVAPEVLGDGDPDERSDVFALGKFIECLHADSNMGFEYKQVVATATAADPAHRYATIDLMLDAISQKRNMRRSLLSLGAAIAIGVLCVVLYMDLMPQPVDVEFVKPVEERRADPYEAGMTPAELGIDDNDSTYMSEDDKAGQEELEAEIERIFRRQFARAAESTLSKMYSKEHMNSSEQNFIQGNNTLFEELLRKRDELAMQSGLTTEKANNIASEIIETIRASKQKQLKSFGYQKQEKAKN